ncbi:MAG: SGNH/GDSL hydrolase family protein [Gemmatimonadota bacterium]
MTVRFHRYVAIGDSSTEGMDDPDGRGGYRGWANRLAERIATIQGSLLYANLGVRGRRTRQIREQQLEPALAMKPDLVTLFSGTNDVVRRHFDPEGFRKDLEAIQLALIASGATVIGFTLPDLTPVMPLGRLIRGKVAALNDQIRAASMASGAICVDMASHPVGSDPRLWSGDRLHANALGHARIAAALAHGLGLPGSDDSWSHPLPPLPAVGFLEPIRAELRWVTGHLLPWVWRHAHGRSSGDGRGPKRPELRPVEV